MEFPETRQQVGRRNQRDFKEPTTHTKLTTNVPSKNVSSSSQTTSSQKTLRTNHVSSNTAKRVSAKDVEVPTGKSESQWYIIFNFGVEYSNTLSGTIYKRQIQFLFC